MELSAIEKWIGLKWAKNRADGTLQCLLPGAGMDSILVSVAPGIIYVENV